MKTYSGRKPERYEIRDEIERIVKEKGIDRKRFYEYSKTEYQKVIRQFQFAFIEKSKIRDLDLNYCWVNFSDDLITSMPVSENIGRRQMLDEIKKMMEYDWNHKLYLIMAEGWVYEGYIDEMIEVLEELDGMFVNDFYIVTPKFDQFACYCEDGESLTVSKK